MARGFSSLGIQGAGLLLAGVLGVGFLSIGVRHHRGFASLGVMVAELNGRLGLLLAGVVSIGGLCQRDFYTLVITLAWLSSLGSMGWG